MCVSGGSCRCLEKQQGSDWEETVWGSRWGAAGWGCGQDGIGMAG